MSASEAPFMRTVCSLARSFCAGSVPAAVWFNEASFRPLCSQFHHWRRTDCPEGGQKKKKKILTPIHPQIVPTEQI